MITLSWNLEGTRLLTGGSTIQLWKERSNEYNDDEPIGKLSLKNLVETEVKLKLNKKY